MESCSSECRECASCEFWLGVRTPDESRTAALVGPDVRGECLWKDRSPLKAADEHCPAWTRWERLTAVDEADKVSDVLASALFPPTSNAYRYHFAV